MNLLFFFATFRNISALCYLRNCYGRVCLYLATRRLHSKEGAPVIWNTIDNIWNILRRYFQNWYIFKHTLTGLDGSKLAQAWNIAHQFYLSSLRRVVNFLLDRTLLNVRYINRIKEQVFECYPYLQYFNNLPTTGYYILSVKIIKKYNKEDFLVLIILYVCTFCPIHTEQ